MFRQSTPEDVEVDGRTVKSGVRLCDVAAVEGCTALESTVQRRYQAANLNLFWKMQEKKAI
jgi:hypothetical protein